MSALKKSLVCVVAGTVLLSGCAAADTTGDEHPKGAQNQVKMVDQNGYETALKKSVSQYRWPKDYTPDLPALLAQTGPGDQGQIQAGGEHTVLGIINSCAWYLSWNSARKDKRKTDAAAALKVMTEVVPGYSKEDPDGQTFARQAAEKAGLGDPTMALQFVTANCDNTKWAKAT